jgi:6-phosphogluconate dehydrogenase
MAEPLHSIWRKGCVILSAILLSISSRLSRRNSSSILIIIIIQFKKATLSKLPKFARGFESYVIYMVVGDDT